MGEALSALCPLESSSPRRCPDSQDVHGTGYRGCSKPHATGREPVWLLVESPSHVARCQRQPARRYTVTSQPATRSERVTQSRLWRIRRHGCQRAVDSADVGSERMTTLGRLWPAQRHLEASWASGPLRNNTCVTDFSDAPRELRITGGVTP